MREPKQFYQSTYSYQYNYSRSFMVEVITRSTESTVQRSAVISYQLCKFLKQFLLYIVVRYIKDTILT